MIEWFSDELDWLVSGMPSALDIATHLMFVDIQTKSFSCRFHRKLFASHLDIIHHGYVYRPYERGIICGADGTIIYIG